MTLDESIYKEEALAYSFGERWKRLGEPVGDLPELEAEHRQMAEWLKELKALKENGDVKDVFKDCDTCKNLSLDFDDYPCNRCMHRYINQYVYDDMREVNADDRDSD